MGKQSTVYKARLMKKMASFVISNIYKQVLGHLSSYRMCLKSQIVAIFLCYGCGVLLRQNLCTRCACLLGPLPSLA